jgi:hypothetical protein
MGNNDNIKIKNLMALFKELKNTFDLVASKFFSFYNSLSQEEKKKWFHFFILFYRKYVLFTYIYNRIKNSQTETIEIRYLPDNFIEKAKEQLYEGETLLVFFLLPLKSEVEYYLRGRDKKFLSIKKFDDLLKCEIFVDRTYFLKFWEDFIKIENDNLRKMKIFNTSFIYPLICKLKQKYENDFPILVLDTLTLTLQAIIEYLPLKKELKKIRYKEENGYGFLIINDKKIKIGKDNTKKCRFLKLVINDFKGNLISLEALYTFLYQKDEEVDEVSPSIMKKKIINNIVKKIHNILKKAGINGFIKALKVKDRKCKFEEKFLIIPPK